MVGRVRLAIWLVSMGWLSCGLSHFFCSAWPRGHSVSLGAARPQSNAGRSHWFRWWRHRTHAPCVVSVGAPQAVQPTGPLTRTCRTVTLCVAVADCPAGTCSTLQTACGKRPVTITTTSTADVDEWGSVDVSWRGRSSWFLGVAFLGVADLPTHVCPAPTCGSNEAK